MSDNTPETRIELANHSRRAKLRDNDSKKESKTSERKLFNKDGKPLNINEPRVDFSLEEQEETNSFVLTLKIYKYLDISLLDVDVQPCYVTVKIKGKIFQITLNEEVLIDNSTAKRSQTTGYLVITMPKMKGEAKPKPQVTLPGTDKERKTACTISKRQYLEIGKDDDDMDFSKIVQNNQSKESQRNLKSKVKEKLPPENFQDNPDVPPLE